MSLLCLCPYLWGDWTRQATGQCFLWFSFCCQCSSRNFQFQNPHFPIIKVQPFLPVQAPLAPKGFLVLHRSKSFLSTSHLSTKTLDFCLSLASHVGSTVLHGMQSLDPQLPAWHPNLGIFHLPASILQVPWQYLHFIYLLPFGELSDWENKHVLSAPADPCVTATTRMLSLIKQSHTLHPA